MALPVPPIIAVFSCLVHLRLCSYIFQWAVQASLYCCQRLLHCGWKFSGVQSGPQSNLTMYYESHFTDLKRESAILEKPSEDPNQKPSPPFLPTSSFTHAWEPPWQKKSASTCKIRKGCLQKYPKCRSHQETGCLLDKWLIVTKSGLSLFWWSNIASGVFRPDCMV